MDAKWFYKFISISIDWISRIILTAIEKILNVFLFKYIIIQRTVHIFRYKQKDYNITKIVPIGERQNFPRIFLYPFPESVFHNVSNSVYLQKHCTQQHDHCTVQYQYLNIARYLILFIMELHKDAFIVLLSWSFINKIWKFV